MAEKTWSVVADGMVQSGFVDEGLKSGEAYQYRVTASNRKGGSGPGNVAFAVTRSADIVGPASVRASAEGNFRVVLNWNDRDWNEDGFVVERSYGGDSWSEMARLPANTTNYVDEAVRDHHLLHTVFGLIVEIKKRTRDHVARCTALFGRSSLTRFRSQRIQCIVGVEP